MLTFTIKMKIFNFEFNIALFNYLIFEIKHEHHEKYNFKYKGKYIGSTKSETEKPWSVNKITTKYNNK